MTPGSGRVFLIGTGPGDPGLITVRGARLLGEADVVVYDRAAEPALRWAAPEAERIAAGAPAEREPAQDAISMLVAEKARDGHVVARLKWGDPFLFDSGGKEALFLHEQGIQFEVVPGVPVAIGSTAYAGVPITYPGGGDVVVLLRGHEGEVDSMPDVDWAALAAAGGTLACYAGGRLIPRALEALLAHGAAPDRPAALIYAGTQPVQRTVAGTIQSLHERIAAQTEERPALLVVGEVTSLREHLRWFDERPLFGRRIVVTRSPEQARALVEQLENLGAQAVEAPTFRLAPPDDPEAVERAAASVDGYDWVVFESANAVARFLGALYRGPRDLRALGGVRVAAIGPSTADRLGLAGIKPDIIVPEFGVDGVGDVFATDGSSLDGRRMLVVRAEHLRDRVAIDLGRRGARVTDVVAYRAEPPSPDSPAAQQLYRQLLEGQIDAVTFTSPTAVQRLAALIGEEQAADLLNTTAIAAIGPVTAAAATAVGITPSIVPSTYTIDGLVQAIVKHFTSGPAPEE
jgi:uroporphyrinogen III methyltransferase/synthase